MTSTVVYNGELRTTCVHVKSQKSIITDAPTDNRGKGQTFSPTDLVATALASCMLTIMGIKAESLSIELTKTKAEVLKIMASNPRRIDEIQINVYFPDNKWSDSIKQSLQRAALSCPVAKSLHPELLQNVSFHF